MPRRTCSAGESARLFLRFFCINHTLHSRIIGRQAVWVLPLAVMIESTDVFAIGKHGDLCAHRDEDASSVIFELPSVRTCYQSSRSSVSDTTRRATAGWSDPRSSDGPGRGAARCDRPASLVNRMSKPARAPTSPRAVVASGPNSSHAPRRSGASCPAGGCRSDNAARSRAGDRSDSGGVGASASPFLRVSTTLPNCPDHPDHPDQRSDTWTTGSAKTGRKPWGGPGGPGGPGERAL